jgi:hypothetical protein
VSRAEGEKMKISYEIMLKQGNDQKNEKVVKKI